MKGLTIRAWAEKIAHQPHMAVVESIMKLRTDRDIARKLAKDWQEIAHRATEGAVIEFDPIDGSKPNLIVVPPVGAPGED